MKRSTEPPADWLRRQMGAYDAMGSLKACMARWDTAITSGTQDDALDVLEDALQALAAGLGDLLKLPHCPAQGALEWITAALKPLEGERAQAAMALAAHMRQAIGEWSKGIGRFPTGPAGFRERGLAIAQAMNIGAILWLAGEAASAAEKFELAVMLFCEDEAFARENLEALDHLIDGLSGLSIEEPLAWPLFDGAKALRERCTA